MSHLVLYDGVCGLCDRFVQFLIRADRHDRLRFAALQGEIAAEVLVRAGGSAGPLDTVRVIPDWGTPRERVLERSDAALFAVSACGGIYSAAKLLRLIPRGARDAAYAWIARNRYRWFGTLESCSIPTKATRARFLDPTPRALPR